jgi:hypothetical protein
LSVSAIEQVVPFGEAAQPFEVGVRPKSVVNAGEHAVQPAAGAIATDADCVLGEMKCDFEARRRGTCITKKACCALPGATAEDGPAGTVRPAGPLQPASTASRAIPAMIGRATFTIDPPPEP